jgi:predicted DNA-binding protein (UPF0251 family)
MRRELLRDVDRDGLPVRTAAQLLGRSERQVWRLLKAIRAGADLEETRPAEQSQDS